MNEVTMGLSRTVSAKTAISAKIAKYSNPRVFRAPADGVPPGIGCRRKGSKTRMMGYRWSKKV